jgi:mRNA interferase HigB
MLKWRMRIVALSTLRTFWEKHPDAETPLRAWYALASRARWKTPADIKAAYRNASFVADRRVVFNIKGNDYRLVVAVRYDRELMYVRFVGSHRQYDRIDVETI